MNKKVITLIVAIIVLAAIAVTSAMAMMPRKTVKPSDYDKGLKYEAAAKLNKPILAFFYVDWCGYCQRFAPKLNLLHALYDSKYSIVMINCEAPENKKLSESYRVGGFPTIYIIDPKIDNRVHIENAYIGDIVSLKGELDRYIRVRKLMNLPSK